MPGKVAERVRRKKAAAIEHEEVDRRGGQPRPLGQVLHHLVEAVALQPGAEVVELRQLHFGHEPHGVTER
jgi:hypothetical protein